MFHRYNFFLLFLYQSSNDLLLEALLFQCQSLVKRRPGCITNRLFMDSPITSSRQRTNERHWQWVQDWHKVSGCFSHSHQPLQSQLCFLLFHHSKGKTWLHQVIHGANTWRDLKCLGNVYSFVLGLLEVMRESTKSSSASSILNYGVVQGILETH